MTKHIGGLALIAAIALTAQASYRADGDSKLYKDAQEIADLLEAGKDKDAKAAVDAFKKKYEDLEAIMKIYKPKSKGGLGVGPMGKGIEIMIQRDLVTRAPAKKDLPDVVKMAYLAQALGKVTHAYAPAKPNTKGKGAKEWKQYSEEQEKTSIELVKALKKGDKDAIKKAATNVNSACVNCHQDFRD